MLENCLSAGVEVPWGFTTRTGEQVSGDGDLGMLD